MSASAEAATTRTVVEQLADVVADSGCRDMFTLMGAGNVWLIHHLATEHGVRIHHLRHENGAIGAADGLARATGEVTWCTVTQGPGFTNTITAILTAHRGGIPMVFIVSDSSNLDPNRFPFAGSVQALAPELLLHPLGIATIRADGTRAAAQLREAYARARDESRPIVFITPAGLDKIPVTEPVPEAIAPVQAPSAPVDPELIRAAADLIEAGGSTVILAGRGAVSSDAGAETTRVAELIGARISTSVPALGFVADHPATIGPFGGFSIDETERFIEEADTLLVVGASLNLFQARTGEFLEGRRIVRIDRDPAVTGDVVIAADAKEALAALADELASRGAQPHSFEPIAWPGVTGDTTRPGLLDSRVVALELDAALPSPRRVFVDNGHFGVFPILWMRHRTPRSLVWLPDFGAVGSALAGGFASAVADDSTQAVVFIGDSGLYMTLGDLETVVRERAPLIVVCMNDGAAGSELIHMGDWGVPLEQAIFGYNDIAALATGMGATGVKITEPGMVAEAIAAWDPESGPLVLDCHVGREVRSPIYDHA